MKIILTLSITLLLSGNAMAMTQAKFVERLIKNHPFFTQQGLTQQAVQMDYVATGANQDWRLSASAQSANQLDERVSSTVIGVTRNIVKTGGDLKLSNTWSDGRATDKLAISYSHPLLKNTLGVNDLLAHDLAQFAIKRSELKLEQSAKAFILAQLYKWVDLSYAQQQLVLINQRLSLAQQELNLIKAKFKQSLVDEVEVLLQEDAYQRVLQKQLQAEQDLDLLKQTLSTTLDMPEKLINSEYDLYQLYQVKQGNLAQQLAHDTTEMKLVNLERSLLKRQSLSDKNNTQALLDFTVGISNEAKTDWNIGLNLSYPLGNTKAKSALEKTHINLAKNQENGAEKLLDLTVKASVLVKKIQHLAKLLNTYQARIDIAKARALAEKKRYELGNSQVSFVISAQNNVHDVNLAYAQAAVRYQKSVLEFKALIGQLM